MRSNTTRIIALVLAGLIALTGIFGVISSFLH